jgi:hypothetical protein
MHPSEMPKPSATQASPVDLLSRQVQLLADLQQMQRQQHEQIERLIAQNQRLIAAFRAVKIADINMPFMALVGFIIKVSLAAIPAYIILAIIGFVMFFILGSCAGAMTRF